MDSYHRAPFPLYKLKHFYYHLIFDHVTGDRINNATGDDKITKRWNIATDLAINSNLEGELPKGALHAGHFGAGGPFEDFESGLSAEQYYTLLEEDEKKKQEQGEAGDDAEAKKVKVVKVKVMEMEMVMVMELETVLMITLDGVTLTTLQTNLPSND